MKSWPKFVALALFSISICPSLRAQTTGNPALPVPSATAQAPEEVMKRLSDLVHSGRYAEAQQLAAGLLMAYPDDQRLSKVKTLLDKSLASPGPASEAPLANRTAGDVAPVPGTNAEVKQLSGMDKVNYNALLELARQAQQTTDLPQQKNLLQQFMTQSAAFLQTHPEQLLCWQLRAASAISLDDPDAGYAAAQHLLAAGAADSNDPALQQLLSQLKIKGWLDPQGVQQAKLKIEEDKKFAWLLGTWNVSFSYFSKAAFDYGEKHGHNQVEFVKSGDTAEGYVSVNGRRFAKPAYRYAVRSSQEIALPTNWQVSQKPPQWEPISSVSFADDRKSMTIVLKNNTYVLTKISDPQNQ